MLIEVFLIGGGMATFTGVSTRCILIGSGSSEEVGKIVDVDVDNVELVNVKIVFLDLVFIEQRVTRGGIVRMWGSHSALLVLAAQWICVGNYQKILSCGFGGGGWMLNEVPEPKVNLCANGRCFTVPPFTSRRPHPDDIHRLIEL
jgi:hypothetical protein